MFPPEKTVDVPNLTKFSQPKSDYETDRTQQLYHPEVVSAHHAGEPKTSPPTTIFGLAADFAASGLVSLITVDIGFEVDHQSTTLNEIIYLDRYMMI